MQHTFPLPDPFIPALHQHLVEWPRFTSWTDSKGNTTYKKPDLFASQAEKRLWKYGDDADRYYRARMLRPLPVAVGNALASVYRDLYRTNNKQKDPAQARRRANFMLTRLYNSHLQGKLKALCNNPLIFKPSELIVEDEYLADTYGSAPELKGLNAAARNTKQNHLLNLLEFYDQPELMPVLRSQGERDDGEQDRQHQTDARHLHDFWNRSDNNLRDYAFDMVRMTYQFMLRLFNAGEHAMSEESLLIRTYHVLCAIPNQMGIYEKYQAVSHENFTHEHAEIGLNRLLCEKWWLRKLRTLHRQKFEEIAIAAGVVHNGKQVYISNETYRYYQQRDAENKRVLQDMVAYNEERDVEVPLMNLIEKSNANPKIRRHELMVRMRGTEEYATAQGDVGMMVTLTAPSRYHPTASKKLMGKRVTVANPKYTGATPKQTNAYLNDVWARIRAALDRFGIHPYGVRVVEPHEDECPHQHYLVFVKPDHTEKVTELFRYYGLQVDGREAGAKRNRVHVTHINKKFGSATGYIAKYISKNIDGYQADGKELDGDNLGNSAAEAAKRVTAWRKCWGIRAFQFFGMPPVGIWRELRKYNSDEISQWQGPLKLEKQLASTGEHNAHVIARIQWARPAARCSDNIIEQVRQWADTGHWDKYIESMGGVHIRNHHRPIQLLKPAEPVINRYKEAVPHRAIGVQSLTGSIITSGETWTLHRKGESPASGRPQAALSGVAQRAEATQGERSVPPRSAVNNCTPGDSEQPQNPLPPDLLMAIKQLPEHLFRPWMLEPRPGSIDYLYSFVKHHAPECLQAPPERPNFNYPTPPQVATASEEIASLPNHEQPLAKALLNSGVSKHLLAGHIKRLRQGMDIRLNERQGLRLVEQPDGSQHLIPIQYHPERDLFRDKEYRYRMYEEMYYRLDEEDAA